MKKRKDKMYTVIAEDPCSGFEMVAEFKAKDAANVFPMMQDLQTKLNHGVILTIMDQDHFEIGKDKVKRKGKGKTK